MAEVHGSRLAARGCPRRDLSPHEAHQPIGFYPSAATSGCRSRLWVFGYAASHPGSARRALINLDTTLSACTRGCRHACCGDSSTVLPPRSLISWLVVSIAALASSLACIIMHIHRRVVVLVHRTVLLFGCGTTLPVMRRSTCCSLLHISPCFAWAGQ